MGNEYQSMDGDDMQLGVKAGVAHWWQVQLCDPFYPLTSVIPERFRTMSTLSRCKNPGILYNGRTNVSSYLTTIHLQMKWA